MIRDLKTVLVLLALSTAFAGCASESSSSSGSGGESIGNAAPASAPDPDPDGCMAATGAAIDAANARGDYSSAGTEAGMPQSCIDAGY